MEVNKVAHFAQIDENGVVQNVIVVDNKDILDKNKKESEKVGQKFIKSIGLDGTWVQASYNENPINGKDRGPYPAIGFLWDGTKFIDPEVIDEEIEDSEK